MNNKIPNTNGLIQIKIKMSTPSQEPPASPKGPNKDLKDMGVPCTFKIKIESQNLEYGLLKTIDQIQIKIKMSTPSKEPATSCKVQNEDLKDIYVLCTFKIKI